jgi:hypothetical protein
MSLLLLAQTVTTHSPVGGGTEALLIGVVVTLANGLIEMVKYAIGRKKTTADIGKCLECRADVKRTLAIVSQVYDGGAPLIYGAHQVGKKLDRVADELSAVTRQLSSKAKE